MAQKELEELKVLEEVSKQWVSWAKNNSIRRNSCILGCNFAHQMLIRLDVDHEVLPVGTTVFNRRGWELFGIPAHRLPDDAWQVNCSSHFDPTAVQFSRPQHDIHIDETLIVPLSEMEVHQRGSSPHAIHLLYRTDEFRTFPIGSGLYSYFLEKWNTVYRRAPDWKISPKELGIPDIIAEMRKGI
jgi:hypothetical protein